MRNFVAATMAATMIATGAFAATDLGVPLPLGKPAGITKAQDQDNTVWYIVAGGLIIAGIALVASNGNSSLVTGTTSTSTSTSTSTTRTTP